MLSYQIYSDSKIAVVGDKDEYHFFLKEIGGRWNPRMKGGAGWPSVLCTGMRMQLKIVYQNTHTHTHTKNTHTHAI